MHEDGPSGGSGESGPHRAPGAWLVVGLLLITAAGLFMVLIPVVRVENCAEIVPYIAGNSLRWSLRPVRDCKQCGSGPRITLVSRWRGKNWWEGKELAGYTAQGFGKIDARVALDDAGIRTRVPITRDLLDQATEALLSTGKYESLVLNVGHSGNDRETVHLLILAEEK